MPLPTHPKGLMARATVGFGRPAEPANAPTPLERPVPAGRGIAVFSLQSRAFCALLFLSFFFQTGKSGPEYGEFSQNLPPYGFSEAARSF